MYFVCSLSKLLTAVLTHHLAWIPTVVPAGETQTGAYLQKHSAKWVSQRLRGFYVSRP